MFRGRRSRQSAADEDNKGDHYSNPLEELHFQLDELERLINTSLDEYLISKAPPVPPPKPKPRRGSTFVGAWRNRLSRRNSNHSRSEEEEDDDDHDDDDDDDDDDNNNDSGDVIPATPDSQASNDDDKNNDDNNMEDDVGEIPFTTPKKSTKKPALETPTKSSVSNANHSSSSSRRKGAKEAKFLPMETEHVDKIVETIRRVAELVVIGERAAASGDSYRKKLDALKDDDDAEKERASLKEKIDDTEKYIAIFEIFFERNGLALITNILTGTALDLKAHQIKRGITTAAKFENAKKRAEENDNDDDDEEVEKTEIDMIQEIDLDQEEYASSQMLPPLAIATQAIQSVSILVQNVSRATSLFFILSNNHVNQLINFSLEAYQTAERNKLSATSSSPIGTPRRFASPELAELTTHLVTFLKSLALRMNEETLQFFLTYPSDMVLDEAKVVEFDPSPQNPQDIMENNNNNNKNNNHRDMDGDRPLDEMTQDNSEAFNRERGPQSPRPVAVKTLQVAFPLYERALEFCSAHQDSFVRVTAMNICLNTLRLTTVQAEPGADVSIDEDDGLSSPDGVLHNAKPLPLRERLAIAQYVCSPSRVERLASPIFTKLAQLWGILEEQFREISVPGNLKGSVKLPEKVARAKELARRQKSLDAFNDTAYNIQDELLLLEDVLKVGLTSLNEQVIEMMFATFVYPLLLQPLLLYFQRSPVPDEILFADPLYDHSTGRDVQESDLTAGEKAIIAAPAKSAFFCLSAVFQFITNQPLLRLLFTALLHPLAPDATGETMIRAKADVACMGLDDQVYIRIDPHDENGNFRLPTDRSTYEFGIVTGKKVVSGTANYKMDDDPNTCVFVLSPALAEILQFRGDDAGLVARTRNNPYRKAVLRCFTLCSQLSDLRLLSVLAVDAAVSIFDKKFLADILFGLDLVKFKDNLKVDKPKYEWVIDDRDIGGGVKSDSRLTLGDKSVGKVGYDYANEVISSFQSCLMKAVPAGKGTWKLEYDMVAAHALLCIVRGDKNALFGAAKAVDFRCRQAAAFLSDLPKSVNKFGGSKLKKLLEATSDTAEKVEGTIMDIIFRGHGDFKDSKHVLYDMIEVNQAHIFDGKPGHGIAVCSVCSYSKACDRCCNPVPSEDFGDRTLSNAMKSARAWMQLDAYSTMLRGLYETEAKHLPETKMGGLLVKRDGTTVAMNDPNTVHTQLSEHFVNALFNEIKEDGHIDARPGRIVSLVGQTAFPCVCEVPPSSAPLFSEAGAKVVSQGITWQSLYLVILGHTLVLAEPERRTSGDGRVVTCCRLENTSLEKDIPDARSDTSARRLIVSNESPETSPPGLFLFEEPPKVQEEGPIHRLKNWTSSLDVWFEDNKAVDLAYRKVDKAIVEAKTCRGQCLQKFLAQGEGSGYPKDES